MTNFGKKMLSFFAVFFLTLCIFGCNMSPEVGDREGLKEAKENVKWLLTNFNFGEVINDNVKDPVIGNVGIAEDLDGKVSENDWRNGSYSEFMYGMSASFESSNPEIMDAKWNIYKKRAYVYGDAQNPDKITGIETKETKALEFVVNRPAPDQEDVTVDITIKVKAPYQIGEQTYYHEGTRTVTFTVLKQPVSNTMTVGELEDYVLANWDAFNNGSLFKDENGNVLNVSIEGIVTEQVWGDGYDNHSFTMADDQGNAIYVYGPQDPVNIGDRVIVTGQPSYYNGTIQIGLKSTVEIVKEASEYVAAEKTTIEEWYAKYPTQNTDHKIPGHRVKVSGLFIQKTVDGYTNYAIQSTESDHFIQIYYKSYGAYEEQLLKEMLGKAAEFELAMYYCHNNGYWVGILNNYDYKPTLIEMSQEDKLTADVAGIKPAVTVKDGEKVELPTGTLENGTVLSGWTADKEGYINLETLVANLGSAKEDVKVTLTATATNGEFSQEVKVEVTIKYTKDQIAEKTVKELIELKEEMLETFQVTGTVVQWGNKIATPDEAPTMYGNFILQGEDGSQIVVYGSTASESALAWDAAAGKYKYTNAKDFLTNELTSQIKLGDKVKLLVVRTSYNGNPQLNAVVLAVNPEQGGTQEPTFGVVTEIKENVAYKLGFAHLNEAVLGKEYFLTGDMNGFYGATVEDHTAAADIYFIAVEGGYQIKLVKADGSIVYVNAVASGTHTNIQFADSATSVWTLNTELNTLITTVDGTEFLLGTRSDKTYNTIGPVAMKYASTTCIVHVYGGSVVTPEPPVHEHKFVEGKCECGEVDPNYQPPVVEPTFGVVTEIKENVAYKLGFAHLNEAVLGKEYFLTGDMNGFYGATVEDHTAAADIYFIAVEGGYQIKLVKADGSIVYVNAVASGTHTNIQFADSATSVWTLNTELNTLITTVDGTEFLLGTRSDKTYNTIGPVAMKYASTTCIVHVYGGSVVTPEPPVHEHKFVEGKCECGEVDPNYQAPGIEEPAVSNKTVAELIALSEEMNASYKVTGKVVLWGNKLTSTDTAPSMYGNFVLEGEDGSKIVVYGATASASALAWNAETGKYTYTNAKDFLTNATTSAIALGDTVELLVVRTSYNGNPQLNAIVLKVTPAAPEHEHKFVEGKCECGEEDPNYVAPEVPEVSANKADLDTMGAKSSSYSDRTSKSGWTATYAALNCGGTTDMNPQFKVFGTENDFALTIAGGTDMVGKITSPVLSNGLSKLSFNYTKLFTDTTLSVTVYVKDVEGNVLYSEVITYAAEKNEKYVLKTYELVLDKPVEGDFVIEIVNNCPTGVTGKKDRISIWNITWENAPKHEHEFVEGKCECGEEDPNYVPPQAEPELFLTVGFESYASNTSAKASVAEGGVTFKTNSVNKMYTDNTPGSIALKFNNSSSSSAGFEATGFEKAIVKMTFKAATWNSAVTFTIVGTTADGQTITVKVDLANTAKAFAADEIVVEFEVPVVSFTFAASKRAFIDDISFYG